MGEVVQFPIINKPNALEEYDIEHYDNPVVLQNNIATDVRVMLEAGCLEDILSLLKQENKNHFTITMQMENENIIIQTEFYVIEKGR